MAEDQNREHEENKRVQRSERATEGHEGSQLRENERASSYPTSLLSDPRLGGRGNGPVRSALMLQMQRTYGNLATRRFLQRAKNAASPDTTGTEDIGQRIQAKSGSGSNLDTNAQRQLEEGLGADLSGVHVHTDGEADQMAHSVDAVAFTTGQDIFFREGAYNPGSSDGMRLLAHEATHTVQQAAGPVAGTPAPGGVSVSDPSDSFEQAAERTAESVMSGNSMPAQRMPNQSSSAFVQRQDTPAPTEEEDLLKKKKPEEGEGEQAVQSMSVGAYIQRQEAPTIEEEEKKPEDEQHAVQPMSNVAHSTSIQRQGKPDVIKGHVSTLGPAIDLEVKMKIRDIIGRFKTDWMIMKDNYGAGINNFADYMQFSDEESAKADYLGKTLEYAGKQIMKEGMKHLAKEIPGVDKVYELTFGYVEEMMKEHDRALKAGSEVKVRNYIVSYRTKITTLMDDRQLSLDDLVPAWEKEFKSRIDSAPVDSKAKDLAKPGTTNTGDRAIAGPGAEYLNDLEKAEKNFRTNIPKPDAYLQTMIEQWVMADENQVKSKGGGDVYMGGRIFLTMKMYKDGDNWTVTERPSKGLLAAEQGGKASDALKRALTEQGKSVNDLAILKVLHIDVEDEVTGFNDHYAVGMSYRDPSQMETGPNSIPSPVEEDTVKKAPAIGATAFGKADISNIKVTELSVY